MSEGRDRFLREIAERLPPERLSELHLFTPMRQGGMESGVAVIAVEPEVAALSESEIASVNDAKAAPADDGEKRSASGPRRHTVYTARYRHTLKGPDRGRWEFEIVAEADAPLVTVDAVVRGVQKRTGELDTPERLGPADLRSALDDTSWRATTG